MIVVWIEGGIVQDVWRRDDGNDTVVTIEPELSGGVFSRPVSILLPAGKFSQIPQNLVDMLNKSSEFIEANRGNTL